MTKPLTPAQQKLIETLASETNVIRVAAERLGISPKMAVTWMKLPLLQWEYDQARHRCAQKHFDELRDPSVPLATKLTRLNVAPDRAAELMHMARTQPQALQAEVMRLISLYTADLESALKVPVTQALEWR